MEHVLGVVNLRGAIIQVLDLPSIAGCTPKTGLNIMLVTEFARTTQAFACRIRGRNRAAWTGAR